MAFYRCGGGGIPSSLKTDMNAVFNKKFGTSGQNYPPKQWPDEVNLLGPLPEGTATGSIAHITDGADTVPIKSWEVTLPASLDGYSAIGCTKLGKNLLKITGTAVIGDLNVTPQADGTVVVNGQRSTALTWNAGQFTAKEACSIIFSGCSGGSASTYSINIQKNNVYQADVYNGDSTVYNLVQGDVIKFIVVVRANVSMSNVVFSPMIRFSVDTDGTFEKYTETQYTADLGRTIYGGEVDIVNGTGTATWKKIVADGVNVKATGGYASGANRLPTIQVSDAVTTSTDIKADYLTTTSSVIGTEDTIMLGNSGASIVLHIGTMQGNDGTHGYSSDAELLLACNSYLADHNLTIVYKLSDANATDFTFTPITPTPETALGVNNFWADEGDSEVTYRADINLALGGQ